ncbi:putative zinc finger protein [Orchesella cincta]|uniref:Putative zinc finger protein n=1 Tax=Orchesella cincta TaxID=48709 RepID=A0A1D2MJC6_ORCCI|nr:putative zinc finger protein [Orchesella cincta]
MHSSSAESSILNISGKESAFTPVMSEFSSQNKQISSLKKPKHRALASFYEKINQKLNESKIEVQVQQQQQETSEDTGIHDDSQKNSSVASTSNRCQHCRQRCKSTADLTAHLEKCLGAVTKKVGESEMGESGQVKVESMEKAAVKATPEQNFQIPPKPVSTIGNISPWNGSSSTSHIEVDESDDGDYESKVQLLNGSADSDGLIGFETAPGVGAIHTGKMDEMEYLGYQSDTFSAEPNNKKEHVDVEEEPESTSSPVANIDVEDDDADDDEEDGEEGTDGEAKLGKSMITTRKVYRCPENDCSFWATTASRFHVHIVGHYNLKPFECSECHYKSNWRWDVNKHIRLKTPKDPKHAKAKTLLTHESGQRDYRKYDNYLVTMALTHSANAKAPDCSTVASKRTKGSAVATPKGSPELASSQKENGSTANSPSTPVSSASGKQKMPKLTKAPASSSSSSTGSNAVAAVADDMISHIGSSNSISQNDESAYSTSELVLPLALPKGNPSEGRSFVETRMLAGGEIYQAALMDQAVEINQEEEDDMPPSGIDLSLKRPRPYEDDMSSQGLMMPSKKTRLQEPHFSSSTGGATNGNNKILSMWQCIKCSFKHLNKDVVSTHIRDQHKPKKGDPVSLLSHNHLIQVLVPEQDADTLLGNNDVMDFSMMSGNGQQKKELYQHMYDENGNVLSCKFCPFTTNLLYEMEIHSDHHFGKSNNHYSCPHCSYSVAVKSELQEHLKLHGDALYQSQTVEIQNRLINSSTMISSTSDSKLSLLSPTSTTPESTKKEKKYHCVVCPYVTNNLSQFQYHKQCHEPRDYPFKCHRCTFNVSVKLHLLQHLRLHGIQIDEIGVPVTQPEYAELNEMDYTSDEPLNLTTSASKNPILGWDSNGLPIEGFRCEVCSQVFHNVNDLKDHEYLTNHTSSRQCDSPPCEAVNLSLKTKKSSHNYSKVNNNSGKRSVTSTPLSSPPIPDPALTPSSASSKSERECLYFCDECPARFFFEKELKIHHTFHENKSTFQCPKCTYSARQKDPHLMSHMKVHGIAYQEKTKTLMQRFPKAKANLGSTNTSVTASLLNSSILNTSYFQSMSGGSTVSGSKFKSGDSNHSAAAEPNMDGMKKTGLSIVCPKCPEKFWNPATFQQHIGYHGRAAEYRCRYCDYSAVSKKILTAHELVHSATDLSTEIATGDAKSAQSSLASALCNPVSMMAMVAHQDTPFVTSGVVASSELENADKNAPVPDEAYEGNPEFVYPTYMKNGRVKSKRYKCMKCPSAFEKKDQYHTHIGLHGSNQKYKCTICDYAVTYYANYIQHLKKHENQRNIPSELLSLKVLSRKGQLDDESGNSILKIPKLLEVVQNGEPHTNSNGSLDSGDGLMRCPFCPFVCGDEPALDSHLIHHQENPNLLHVCPTCSFRTSSKKSLKEHSKCHMPANYHHDWKNGQQKRIGRPPKKLAAEYQNGKMENGEHKVHQLQYRSDLHEDISSNESI